MKTCKVNINGKMVEISLSIPDDEIERNELDNEDTLDLSNEVKEVNEENK